MEGVGTVEDDEGEVEGAGGGNAGGEAAISEGVEGGGGAEQWKTEEEEEVDDEAADTADSRGERSNDSSSWITHRRTHTHTCTYIYGRLEDTHNTTRAPSRVMANVSTADGGCGCSSECSCLCVC